MTKDLIILLLIALSLPTSALPAGERANYFDDPFLQVTNAIPDCPKQDGPLISPSEMRAEAHERAERGTRCFQSGRCRLPNSYLYDKEIIPRVKEAITADGRFSETSIWVEGKRRWVWLKGCVRKRAESVALEQLVRSIDDVEHVINLLVVRR
jgi:BON domain